jgi:hypothetical protein
MRPLVLRLVGAVAASLVLSHAALGETYTVHHGATVLRLDQEVLARSGLSVRVVTDEQRDDVTGELLRLLPFSEVEGLALEDGVAFSRGIVEHREPLEFANRAGRRFVEDARFDLSGKELADGVQLMAGSVSIDLNQASITVEFDAIRLTPEFATLIGAPELGEVSIGDGVAELFLSRHLGHDNREGGARGDCTPSTGPDVIIGDLPAVGNYASVGGIDAFSVGTTSCNIGDQNLLWVAQSVNHPVIPQNMYRLKTVDGAARFEQIGMSWMKHGFTALTQSLCCTCNGQGGAVLGVGCSDPYSAALNGEQVTSVGGLGPRFQVNPHSGAFIWPYMFRNVAHIPHTTVTRRLQVHVDDLNPALNGGALYYIEAQYITPDDAAARNQDNNVSYRRINITGTNPNFSAAVTSTVVREQPAIRAWKTIDPNVTETLLSTPEAANSGGDTTGVAILSAKATGIGGGITHYEYALYNMNSDRGFSVFEVPVGSGATVTNISFHDVSYHSGDGFGSEPGNVHDFDGTDWNGLYNGFTVRWEMVPVDPIENSNALRWGTLYNFRFDANVAAESGAAMLGFFKPVDGAPNSIQATTVVPLHSAACPGDLDGDGVVDTADLARMLSGFGAPGGPSEGDLNGDGVVGIQDLAILLSNFSASCF